MSAISPALDKPGITTLETHGTFVSRLRQTQPGFWMLITNPTTVRQ